MLRLRGKQFTLNAEQKKSIDACAIWVCAFSLSSDMLVPSSGMPVWAKTEGMPKLHKYKYFFFVPRLG